MKPRMDLTRTEKSMAMLLLLMLLIGAGNLVITTRYFNDLQKQIHASCAFAKDIGTAPIKPVKPAKTVPRLAVVIVTDARISYDGRDCPGKLPPPSDSLVYWARHYHITLPASP